MTTALARSRTVVALLEAATDAGLPDPRYVTFHNDYRKVGVQLASAVAVAEWAAWIGAPLDTSPADTEGGVIHRASGDHGDVHVDAYHVEYVKAVA